MKTKVTVRSLKPVPLNELPRNTYFRVTSANSPDIIGYVGVKYAQEGRSHVLLLSEINASNAVISSITGVEAIHAPCAITIELEKPLDIKAAQRSNYV